MTAMELRTVPVDDLAANPDQPRKSFDERSLDELAESIRQFGVLQPILAFAQGPGLVILAGERRWRASRIAGLSEVPVLVVPAESDARTLAGALVENLQRQDLNPLEQAAALDELARRYDLTHEQIGQMVGKSRSYVTSTIALQRLPERAARRVASGVLSAGHAKVLLSLRDPEAIDDAAEQAVAQGMTVRNLEEYCLVARREQATSRRARRPAPPSTPGPLAPRVERLSERLSTRVVIQKGNVGRLVISFADTEDLVRILDCLDSGAGP